LAPVSAGQRWPALDADKLPGSCRPRAYLACVHTPLHCVTSSGRFGLLPSCVSYTGSLLRFESTSISRGERGVLHAGGGVAVGCSAKGTQFRLRAAVLL